MSLWNICSGAVLVVAATAPIPQEELKDEVRLQGEWQAIEIEVAGAKRGAEAAREFRLVIKGDEFIIGDRKAKFRLNSVRSPKSIDVTPLEGPPVGKAIPGIYSLEAGRLKICIANGGGAAMPRPAAFKTEKGTELHVITLERVKPK